MAKKTFTLDPRITKIFDDLEDFLDFCRYFGYKYNEADLYNWKSYAFQQFNKYNQGKPVKDAWYQR